MGISAQAADPRGREVDRCSPNTPVGRSHGGDGPRASLGLFSDGRAAKRGVGATHRRRARPLGKPSALGSRESQNLIVIAALRARSAAVLVAHGGTVPP
jgi:hypothetical protein